MIKHIYSSIYIYNEINNKTFKLLFADAAIIFFPVKVDPVKATLSTLGWDAKIAPVVPGPERMLTTPGGKPTSRINFANQRQVKGVFSDGYICINIKIWWFN